MNNKEVKNLIIKEMTIFFILFVISIFLSLKLNNLLVCLLVFFVGIILIIINYLFIKWTYEKINSIDSYINDILNGNHNKFVNDFDGDLAILLDDSHKMGQLIKEQCELLTKYKNYLENLLNDLSIQTKIPLDNMNLINMNLEKTDDIKKKKEFLNENKKQIEKLEVLISSLLKIAKLDNNKLEIKKENIKISSLISKALEPLNKTIKAKKINVKLNLKNTNVIVDIELMSEAIRNVLKNALEHTKNEVIIENYASDDSIEIRITDNGEGINDYDLPHIFESFYKSKDKGSVGIGLTLSKKIIESQNGIIEVSTKKNVGTTFIIKISK